MTADLRAILARFGVDPEAVETRPCAVCNGTREEAEQPHPAGGRWSPPCTACCCGRVPDGTETLLAALERESRAWALGAALRLAEARDTAQRERDEARETLRRWRVRLRWRAEHECDGDLDAVERIHFRALIPEERWGYKLLRGRGKPIAGPRGVLP